MVRFGLVQVSKIVNGSVSNRFGLDPLEPNRTVADCWVHLQPKMAPSLVLGLGPLVSLSSVWDCGSVGTT